MSQEVFQITVLGARGSIPVSGEDTALFGGATSCYMVRAGDETVFLDAGSGLWSAPVDFPRPPVILLSHLHLDHMVGLGMYGRMMQPGKRTEIYLPVQSDGIAVQTLERLYSPPFWPKPLTELGGEVAVYAQQFPLELCDVAIDGTEGSHPGGCMILRLRRHGKTVVYATDFCHTQQSEEALLSFAAGADLLLYDGQFTPAEFAARPLAGHSTAEKAVELMERGNIRRVLLIHHGPGSADAVLAAREAALGRENVRYARQGQVISI
ncbi:MAG: hypothetical protein J5482_04145 [Oscillospiraceae bacterium]|nr:hypothetical protein [Oscillospiraceae bacterium]